MIDDNKYDVVVVGAGPGGSIAARTAAEKGARTLLLERDAVIGTPVRCAEAALPKNVEKFVKIEDRFISNYVDKVVLYAPDGTSVRGISENETGMILERCVFDRFLAEQAAKAGADVMTKANVDGLIIPNGRVDGVYYTKFSKRYAVKAGVVIGADGVESRVGRWAGIKTQLSNCDLESTYQMMLSGIDIEPDTCHFYLGSKVAPGGYIWVFPKGTNSANVGIGVSTKLCDAGTAYRNLVEFIRKRFKNPSVVGEMAGGVPVSKPLKKLWTDGLLLVGDAGRLCNPLTGGGIYTAILSGYHAGAVAAEAVAKGDTSENTLTLYQKRIHNELIRVNLRAYRISEAVRKLTDETLNRTAHEISAIPIEKRNTRTIFLRALMAHPKLTLDIIRAFS